MIRYYRFAVGASSNYEAMRSAGDASLSLVAPDTCISPASSAPTDIRGRLLLAVSDGSIVFPAIAPSLNALLASTIAEEISRADYQSSFEAVTATGGGVSSWNDLTDKPSTFTPSAHKTTHATGGTDALTYSDVGAQKPITVSSSAPTGGTSGDIWLQTAAAGQVTPATITADQNDYAPGAGDIYRISSNAARSITGWTAWSDGTVKLLVNVGGFAITLKHQSTSSSANNRFITPWAGDFVLGANGGSAVMFWDATDSRVRVI